MRIRFSLLAPLAALALLTACDRAGGGAPIHIGIAGPIEAANGRGMRMAAEMAVAEINEAGGVNGRPLALVMKNDDARPARAIEVAAELRDDPRVVAVVGHINSPATLAAAEIYNDPIRGVLQISPASSNPRVAQAGAWTFRVCPSDLLHGPALAEWTYRQLGRRRAAILYANDDYGRGVRDSFGEAFSRAGGQVIERNPYLAAMLDGDGDVEPYLQRAIRDGMDALVIGGQAEGALKIVQSARRLGFNGPVLGADGLTNLKDAGSIADGIFISSAFLPDRNTEVARTFVKAFGERFNELPDHRAAMTYDAVYLLARALEEVGPDRKKLRDYVASVGRTSAPYHGVSGTISFDENGDVRDKEVIVGVVKDGKLVSGS
jgi:branched-chain amino acid transport system substrate-binding protein